MLSPQVKRTLAQDIQKLLQGIDCQELPDGPISFILHIDGKHASSYANIEGPLIGAGPVPQSLKRNMTWKGGS